MHISEMFCFSPNISMQLIEKIRKRLGIKDYSIAKRLNELGIPVTVTGITGYSKSAKSMRLDILCGLRRVSGVSWSEFGKWLDDEFANEKE